VTSVTSVLRSLAVAVSELKDSDVAYSMADVMGSSQRPGFYAHILNIRLQ